MPHSRKNHGIDLPAEPRTRSISIAILIGILIVVVYSTIRVHWLPAITPDGLNYLDHSNDLLGIGFVQHGYRQFAYPAWLAFIDGWAGIAAVEPLGLTVVLQRLMLVVAAAIAFLVMRWWSIPIVLLLLSPSAIAFSNFVLTETIAIPVAVIGASASVAILQHIPRKHLPIWLISAAVAGAILPMIRLHYTVISGAIAIAIFLYGRSRDRTDRASALSLVLMATTFVLLIGVLTLDNYRESDMFFPSIGAERQMFWATWENVAMPHREQIADALPDVYLDGSDFAFIRHMDRSNLSPGQQRHVYADVVDRIYATTGVSKTSERLRSFVGVITGGRLDDTGGPLRVMASPAPLDDAPAFIHQYGSVMPIDPATIGLLYNDGVNPTPVLAAAHTVPAMPAPDLRTMMVYLIPTMLLVGIYLLGFVHARGIAAISIGVILVYATASYLFMMDNLRFLLPAYVFFITMMLGAMSEYWFYDRTGERESRTAD